MTPAPTSPSISTMANAQVIGAISLMDIPTELLDQITRLLPRSALRALALTSKTANKSATEVLYKVYLNRTAPAKAPFYLFLRTLCERPELAAKVKRVDIRGWRSEYEVATGAAWRAVTEVRDVDQIEKSRPSFTSTETTIRGSATQRFQIFVKAAVEAKLITRPASLSVPALKSSIVWYTTLKEDDDFLRLLGRGVEDAQLILMLALLPNMQALRIDGLSPFPLLDWHRFLSRSSTALRKLSIIRIHGSATLSTEPVVKNGLQFLDMVPSLVHLHLVSLAADGHRFTLKTLPSSELQYLCLSNCGINVRLLRKIIIGQSLRDMAYLPGPVQVEESAGSEISVLDLVASLADSKVSLKRLTLFPIGIQLEYTSLGMFENLEALEIPHPGILDIPRDETDPATVYTLLAGQLPATLTRIVLRYLGHDFQTRIIIEQLALLRMRNTLPDLDMATFNFQSAVASHALAGVLSIGGPTGALTAGTIWDPLPKVVSRVEEEFGELYNEAGICMLAEQTDC
jgi:hypothetical protein